MISSTVHVIQMTAKRQALLTDLTSIFVLDIYSTSLRYQNEKIY